MRNASEKILRHERRLITADVTKWVAEIESEKPGISR